MHTHLFRGTGRCSAHRWPPGQCPPQCAWFGHLWAGRAEPHRQAGSHPQFLGGIWSPRGSWCHCDRLLSSFCGHTERRSDVIDSDQAGLLNKQNALGQRVQNCFCFINSCLSKTTLQSFHLWNKGWLTAHLFSQCCFSRLVWEKKRRKRQKNRVSCSYHPRATANEWTAVALQFRCGESLVNIFDGVGTDHCSAPEQRQREK